MAANFNLEDYVQVNERIELFYKDHPEGSIQTEITHLEGDMVIIKAYAYRNPEDPRPCTGHAMEKAGSTFINKTSHIENCETSAVGRALAMMGYEIKKSVASREEVANARLNQGKQGKNESGDYWMGEHKVSDPLPEELKCSECGETINQAVFTFSSNKLGRPLCLKCQNKAKKAGAK